MLRYGAVAAGGPRLIPEEAEDRVALPADWAKGEEVFLLRVQGESMSPTILSGDQVIVRRQERLPEGAVGVFRLDNEVTLKRWHREGDRVRPQRGQPGIRVLDHRTEKSGRFGGHRAGDRDLPTGFVRTRGGGALRVIRRIGGSARSVGSFSVFVFLAHT